MLERVRFGRTGLMVTKLAFGGIPIQRVSRLDGIRLVKDTLELGINFIDTAHGYGHSEELIGEAIRTVPRDSVVIATKSPAADGKTLLADLNESLRRLHTDHVDVFQLHNVDSREKMAAVMAPHGAFESMKEGIRAGKIRFAAFSTHSLRVAAEMIRTDCFDAVQIPFNFVDCHSGADAGAACELQLRFRGVLRLLPHVRKRQRRRVKRQPLLICEESRSTLSLSPGSRAANLTVPQNIIFPSSSDDPGLRGT